MNLPRAVSQTFVFRLLGTVLGFVGLVAFVRLLGPARYGSFILFQGVMNVLALLAAVGLDTALEKRVSGPDSGPYVATTLALKLLTILPVSMAIVVFREPLGVYLGADIALLVVPALVLYTAGRTFRHVLRAELRVAEAEAIRAVQRVVFVGGGVAALLDGGGLREVLFAFLGSLMVTTVLAVYAMDTGIDVPSLAAARSLFRFLRYSAIVVMIGGPALEWTDSLIIGWFVSPTLLTAYQAAWQITRAAGMLSGVVSSVVFPQVSTLDGETTRERIVELIPEGLALSTVLVVPATAGAIVIGRDLLVTLFDPAMGTAAVALVILLIGRVFESVNDVVGHVLFGMGRANLVARSAAVFVFLVVGLNLILVSRFGITGGAVATAVALLVNAILNAQYLRQYIPIRVPRLMLVRSVVASVVMVCVVGFARQFIIPRSALEALGLVALGGVVYVALMATDSEVSGLVRNVFSG